MSGKPAGPAADPAVAVVGSLTMDLVIRVPELPGPGQTVSGGDLLASLQADGGDHSRVRVVDGVPSGTAFITVSEDGENQIVVSPGANSHLTGADVAAARAAGGRVVLNPAPVRDLPEGLLGQVDVLVPNRVELAGLADALAGGAGLGDAAQRAVRVAAAACLRQGAQASLPTPSKLDTLSEPSRP